MSKGVSVIIPVYNGEKYLQECLDSVLQQSFADIQIICVNDGSTDGSAAILEKYAARDARIEIITQPNRGLSSARNQGLTKAKGKYVQFIDCDDRLAEGALAKLYEQAEDDQLDILYYDGTTFYDEGNAEDSELSRYGQLYHCKVPITGVVSGLEMFEMLYDGRSYRASACLQIIRREYLIEKQISFYEGILYEDNLFTLISMTQALRTGYCHQVCYERRIHGGSIVTSRKSFRHARSYVVVYTELCRYAFANPFSMRVMEGIMAQIRSLKAHAVEAFGQLTEEEKAEARQRDASYELVQLICKADKPKEHWFIPRTLPENPFLRFWALFPLRVYNARRMLMDRGWRAVFEKLCSKLNIKQGRYHPSIRALKVKRVPFSKDAAPFVSVILPVHNGHDYLEQTIASLEAQTLKNAEFIFVDDGSTDDSVHILQKAALADPRILVIRQENTNAGEARNHGMKHARGEYLLFLDSDDTFHPDLLAWTYSRAVEHDAQVVIFDADMITHPSMEQTQPAWLQISRVLPSTVFSGREAPNGLFQVLNPWTKLYKRTYIQKMGIQYQSQYSANDVYFTIVALACAQRMITLPFSLVHYHVGRQHNIQSQKDKTPLCGFQAFLAARKKLEELKLLPYFERELTCKAMESMLRELETLKSEKARSALLHRLQDGGLRELGIEFVENDPASQKRLKEKLVILQKIASSHEAIGEGQTDAQ